MLLRRAAQKDARFASLTADSFTAMAFVTRQQVMAAVPRDDLSRLLPSSPVLALVKDVLLGTILADR